MSRLFLIASRPGRLHQSAPKDDPAWIYAQSESSDKRKPTPTEKLLAAHRYAAEVRERKGMKVMKTVMASWTADDA